jgi:hypothetical protein
VEAWLRRAAAGALALWAVAATGCAGEVHAPAPSPAAVEPSWTDVFRPAPPVLLAFHPRSLEADPLFGPLLRKALALARLHSPVAAATHALDAVEDADEVVCGLRPLPGEAIGAGDLLVAIVGVRADIDPAALVDAVGQPLWSPGPSGRVRELVRAPMAVNAEPEGADAPLASEGERGERGALDASLFELPGRAWVIASGREAARARDVFARPRARSGVILDGEPLALLRIDGPSLVARVPFLHGASELAPVGRRLRELAVTLGGGSSRGEGAAPAIAATLTYADTRAADASEAVLRDAVAAIDHARPDGLAWLAGVTVARPTASSAPSSPAAVVLSLPLPAELLAALRSAAEAPGSARDRPRPGRSAPFDTGGSGR